MPDPEEKILTGGNRGSGAASHSSYTTHQRTGTLWEGRFDVDALVMERLQPIQNRLAALEQTPAEEPATCARFDPLAVLPEPAAEPDWNLVRRHYRRYGNPEATAAKYGITVRDLKARARG